MIENPVGSAYCPFEGGGNEIPIFPYGQGESSPRGCFSLRTLGQFLLTLVTLGLYRGQGK